IAAMSPEQQEKMRELLGEERFKELLEQQKKEGGQKKNDESSDDEILTEDERAFLDYELRLIANNNQDERAEFDDDPQQKKGGKGGGFKGGGAINTDYRNFSPDKSVYTFVKNHNLYVAEAGKEDQAVQLTKDGEENYTFTA